MLHRTGCLTRKSATNTVGHVWKGITVHVQWFFERVMSILTFSAFCGPSASFRYVILKLIAAWRNGMHIASLSADPTIYMSQIGNPWEQKKCVSSYCTATYGTATYEYKWTFRVWSWNWALLLKVALCDEFEPHCGILRKRKSDVFPKRHGNIEA